MSSVRYGRQIGDDELERAMAAGKIRLTVRNKRPIYCCRIACRKMVPEGTGRRLWVDGFARGFLCPDDCRGLP